MQEEVVRVLKRASDRGARGSPVQDHVALAEIELCSELMIAAAAATGEERLSQSRIDEILGTRPAVHETPH